MSEMVEYVAAAIREEATRLPEMNREDGNKFYALSLGRAAIAAMREPMPEMVKSGNAAMKPSATALDVWKAMHAEALK